MIIENITVTSTPTSLYDLLVSAGRTDLESKQYNVRSISARIDQASSVIVYASDPNTIIPVVLVDPANSQPYESHIDSNLHQTMLSAGSSVILGVIIS